MTDEEAVVIKYPSCQIYLYLDYTYTYAFNL
jgi:hypothetical protein